MTREKVRSVRSLVLACVLALVAVASGPAADRSSWTAATYQMTLNATHDTYTDLHFPSATHDERLLTASNSAGPPEEPDVTTKQVFLGFDLSSVDFTVRSARLSLSTLTCGGLVPVDTVDLALYGVDNTASWSEDTLTWDSQPVTSTNVLASLDAGSTTFDGAQTYTWTDLNQGAFATWLESQRGAGSATLVVVIKNADEPGLADISFEDREGTGAAYGCGDSLGGPTLSTSSMIGDQRVYLPYVSR